MNKLNYEWLRYKYYYDCDTGIFYRRHGNELIPTGSRHISGYLTLWIDDTQYYLHRVIWLWCTGAWPLEDIDHKDRNTTNNRWGNLYDKSHKDNMQNKSNFSIHGKYIYRKGNSFYVKIDRKYIGASIRLEDAVKLRDEYLLREHQQVKL